MQWHPALTPRKAREQMWEAPGVHTAVSFCHPALQSLSLQLCTVLQPRLQAAPATAAGTTGAVISLPEPQPGCPWPPTMGRRCARPIRKPWLLRVED